jgi:hypothetical protein
MRFGILAVFALIAVITISGCTNNTTPGTNSGTNSANSVKNLTIISDYHGKTVDFGRGVTFEQGIPIDLNMSNTSCSYSMYFNCSIFQGGCSTTYVSEFPKFCSDRCLATGGRALTTPFGLYTNNVLTCMCITCMPVAGGKKDFEFYNAWCQNFDGKNVINVYVNNTGQDDIFSDDWAVHKIDGADVDVFSGPTDHGWIIEVWQYGHVFPSLYQKEANFAAGEHTIELGLSGGSVKTKTVICK